MKKQNAFSILKLWMLLSLIFGIQSVKAQNEPLLSGSNLKSEDITLKVDVVFIGEVTEAGLTLPTSPGISSYSGVQVKVLQILRGSIDARAITLKLSLLAAKREEPPRVGTSYIFFVNKEGDRFEAVKLMLDTVPNTTKIKAVIAAIPTGK